MIGAISGAILYSLLATGLVTTKLFEKDVIVHGPATIGADYDDLAVFLVGFVAGFLERLVPNLLSKTNFGTAEPAGKDTPVQVVPAASDGGQEGKAGTAGASANGEGDAELATDPASVTQEAEGVLAEQVEAPEAVAVDDADPAAQETAVVPDNPDTGEQPRPQGA